MGYLTSPDRRAEGAAAFFMARARHSLLSEVKQVRLPPDDTTRGPSRAARDATRRPLGRLWVDDAQDPGGCLDDI